MSKIVQILKATDCTHFALNNLKKINIRDLARVTLFLT
jgi:hypothetical protein